MKRASKFRRLAAGIVCCRDVMYGAACIEGTRITPRLIASRFFSGKSIEFLMKDHRLTRKQVEDAIRYTRTQRNRTKRGQP